MSDVARILLADDDIKFSTVTSRILQKEGFHCDCASDGDSAEQMLKTNDYDVLISDIDMPGNRDLELIKRVYEISPGLPVILATAFPTVNTAVESLQLPVFSYLLKPLNYQELFLHVYRAVARRKIVNVMRASEHRVTDWMNNLNELSGLIQSYSTGSLDLSLRTFISLTFNNMIGGMGELKTLLEIAYWGDKAAGPCRIAQCPLKQKFETTIENTIITLRETKGVYKCKEIGELRKQLELILADERSQLGRSMD